MAAPRVKFGSRATAAFINAACCVDTSITASRILGQKLLTTCGQGSSNVPPNADRDWRYPPASQLRLSDANVVDIAGVPNDLLIPRAETL